MEFVDCALSGLKIIRPQVFCDERGYFFEEYRKTLFAQHGIDVEFVQGNISFSKKGVLRGLHFQSDPGQAKLVSCVQGEVWDVAVDIRPHSATFMQWEATCLDDRSHEMFYIPIGFAHGFVVLSETAQVCYKVSATYNPATECAIRWNDPDLNVAWPVDHPILSPRDQNCPLFKEMFYVLDHRR